MAGETDLVKIEDIDDSMVHDLQVFELNLCVNIVSGGMAPYEAARLAGISKNKATMVLKKPAVVAYIDFLKKKLTVNAVDSSLNQLRAIQDKSFQAVISKFGTPDHIRDLPREATPDMIRDYYKSFALYTPIDKLHKIHSDSTKSIVENSPESAIKKTDDVELEDKVRAKFQKKVTRQKRLTEELSKRGIPASQYHHFGISEEDGAFIELNKPVLVDTTVPKADDGDIEITETTVTFEGSLGDLSKLSLFDEE